MSGKRIKIAISFTIVIVLLVWLVLTGFNESMQYYVSIEEVNSMKGEALSKGLRVKGNLVPGSVEKSNHSLEVFFIIEENGHQMKVRYDKELPDTFVDGSEVLVEGKFTQAGYFDAEMLMAKCPSKYESSDGYDVESSGVSQTNSGIY